MNFGEFVPKAFPKRIDVFLDQSNYSKLRPNMTLDLMVIQVKKDSVLRVKKGPAFGATDTHSIYSKEYGKAHKREIKTGLEGDEYIEIEEGASAGDDLIISDISSLRKLEEVEIN